MKRGSTRARPGKPDKYDLYERAAQAPSRMAPFLRGLHPGAPAILGEDFCGSGAIARAWVSLDSRHSAVCVDKDAAALAALWRRCDTETRERLTRRRCDVLAARDRADVLVALNFPLGYWHTRESLVRYLRHARSRLKAKGFFVADTYGGRDAFAIGRYEQTLPGAIRYIWEQREADPLTGRVLNAMHFRVGKRWVRDAFTYDWRLWSIPELRDAYTDAGFAKVEVHSTLGDAVDARGRVRATPLTGGADLDENYVVYVVGRR